MPLYWPGDSIPVKIRGVTYESQAKAAKELGITQKAVSLAYKEGRLDTVGLFGRGRKRKVKS